MPSPGRFRFSMAAIMMLVVTAAAGSALFVRLKRFSANISTSRPDIFEGDAPLVMILALSFTAIALGTIRRHSAIQIMLQMTLSFLMPLVRLQLNTAGDAGQVWAEHAAVLWFQTCFFLTVVLPLIGIRSLTGREMDPAQRNRWQRTFEAILASFLTVCFVCVGMILQLFIYEMIF
jgi:hypothetical protein